MLRVRKQKNPRPRVVGAPRRTLVKECDELRQEVSELQQNLTEEIANGFSLENKNISLDKELNEAKFQWERQKTLKEMYINRGKETKRALESLEKYTNPETLSSAKIAAQVRNHIKRKKKKDLQKDYEELQVAHIISQEKLTAELQVEKEKNTFLQNEVDRISASYHEVNLRYDAGVVTVGQKAESLQRELEKEIQQKNVLLKYYEELQAQHRLSQERFTAELQAEREKNKLLQEEMVKMRASHLEVRQKVDTLQQDLEKERQQKILFEKYFQDLQVAHSLSQQKFAAELKEEKDRNRLLQENLERISASHQEVSLRYETDVIKVRQQADNLKKDLEKEMKQQKVLQNDFEELHAAHTLSQNKFTAELQREGEKNKLLREELERIAVSHHEISQRYETDVLTARQQAETLQCQLDKEVKAHAATVAEGWTVINSLRAELEALQQKMAGDLQEKPLEKEGFYGRQLEELKTQLNYQVSLNLELSNELKAEREEYRPPRKRARREETHEDELCRHQQALPNTDTIQALKQESIPNGTALEIPADVEETISQTTETPSIWKRTRHFLGLRKPQSWKK